MTYDCIMEERSEDGALVTITLNRPDKLNAMTTELMNELFDCFSKLEVDKSARVIILTGAGRAFCAGADLLANARGIGGKKWDSTRIENQEVFSRVILKMASIPQLIICAVRGAAAGGGFSLALAGDIRICSESAKFNAAFIKIGLSGCEMGSSYHLPRYVGLSNAFRYLATGDFIPAQRAYEMGLVSEVVKDEDLQSSAVSLAKKCLEASWLGLRMTKKHLRGVADGASLAETIHAEDTVQVLCLNDEPTKAETREKTRRFTPKTNKSKL